jgi:RNA polymerase-associated protein CTR9
VLNEGHLRAGRIAHLERRYDDAIIHYTISSKGHVPLASIGIAQCHIQKGALTHLHTLSMKLITVGVGETPAAIHVLDTMLNGPESQRVVEATIMLASLRASERPALSAQEYATDKAKARELFERVKRNAASHINGTSKQHNGNINGKPKKAAWLNDMEMHLEIARLWEAEDVGKAMNAYQEARIISEKTSDGVDPRIVNNIAVLSHLRKDLLEARTLYEEALSIVSTVWAAHPSMDAMSTTILYNLARIYEDQGEISMAKEAFDKLLSQHPEYVDGMCPQFLKGYACLIFPLLAKVRLAHMLLASNRGNEANTLLKQALDAQVINLNLRAYYTYFLLQSNMHQHALKFVHYTLQLNKSDLYGTCAAAWLHYHLAREIRSSKDEVIRDRRHKFKSAAEFYEKALSLDPGCAIAAQGLAIMVAEDALGILSLKGTGGGTEDEETRMKNTRDALDVFAKVREVIADGSVYTNMGHCYYLRDEYERAIESVCAFLLDAHIEFNQPFAV